ncbi:LysR family transcriptional regulator [Flexibacterium corallicola]|uniref:LysR family transcriptional regulator n=1 Tax=Flexibacterium corallicola TaxID=3037259 RepID=UPI00286F699C|nr:LysR family transcriptional regulator [Pseudovibrio sp. M1P-2-3]
MSYLESLRVFARIVELGSITAGGRDLRLTPAVASKRIKELEKHLGVRLFNRTTRSLQPTEVGKVFYEYAVKTITSVDDAEAAVALFSGSPRGVLRVAAPLGVGRRVISPLIPLFVEENPAIEVRMRLTDRKIDVLADGLDLSFFIGSPSDSNLKLRKISDCDRVLCASPDYLDRYGVPENTNDLIGENHNCLLLRFPHSPEYFWALQTVQGLQKLHVSGKYDADDSGVLTEWAVAGHGIVNRPRFEVAEYLRDGRLVEVLPNARPEPTIFGCLYPHRRLQDPKIRRFVDFVVENADLTDFD